MYSRILWGREPGIMLEFLILMMFLCVLTGEGKKEKKKTIAEWFRLESKERVIRVAVCWSFISFGSLEAQPMPRREANASSLILYLSSTAFPSHQGRRLLLVTVATARSPSQLRYCTFCSPSRDAAVRKDRPREIPGSSFLLRSFGL